jgi:hypothetical protein
MMIKAKIVLSVVTGSGLVQKISTEPPILAGIGEAQPCGLTSTRLLSRLYPIQKDHCRS